MTIFREEKNFIPFSNKKGSLKFIFLIHTLLNNVIRY